jgi:tetratricopeptide (TPR) repeat protein
MLDRNENNQDRDREELVKRFEEMVNDGTLYFFESEDFEDIIDHYIDQNDHAKALNAIEIASRHYPYTVSFSLRKAQIFSATNRTQEALNLLSQLELMESTNAELQMTKGGVYSQMGLSDKAIECFKKAAENDKDSLDEIYLYIAYEFETTSQYDDAIYYLKKALLHNAENQSALYELNFCYDVVGKEDESITYFQNFVDNNPYSHVAWFNLGISFSRKKQYSEAVDAYDYALVIDETFASAHFNKGNALAHMQRYAEAIEVYREVLKLEEHDAVTFYYIGECMEKLELYEEAMVQYNKATMIDPLLADAWMGMGIVLDCQDRLTEGIHYIKKALEISPDSGDFWHIYAEVQERLGFFEEAEAAYKRVIELDPANTEVWLDLSEFYTEQNQPILALEALSLGVKNHPNDADLQYRMAAFLMSKGDKQEGMQFLTHALSLNYARHFEMFEFFPQLRENSAVLEVIESFRTR